MLQVWANQHVTFNIDDQNSRNKCHMNDFFLIISRNKAKSNGFCPKIFQRVGSIETRVSVEPKCIDRESNPGRPRGRRAFYHWTIDACIYWLMCLKRNLLQWEFYISLKHDFIWDKSVKLKNVWSGIISDFVAQW